jgi:hypothetical protein
VLIEGVWDDPATETGNGLIRFRAWGENAESLMDPLLEALQKLPLGHAPEIQRIYRPGAHAASRSPASTTIRLVSTPPVAQPPDIVRQEGSKQVDRSARKTLQDLIFTKDPIMKDFFISYTKADQPWAEWIAWTLEAAGYSTVIQVWDFLPGSNFVLEMQRAATEANRTIAVLSQKYLDSTFTKPEWAAAFAQDPEGKTQKLIPIRIEACQLTGLLASIVYLDLVGLPENDARTALLGAFSIRNKPASAPAFPGTRTPQAPGVSSTQPTYPGATEAASAPIADVLSNVVESADQSRRLSAAQRLQFMRQLNEIVPQHFNMLLFAVNPPAGLIPPMPAAQGDRTSALLTWAESRGGCGLSVLQELLDTIVKPTPSLIPLAPDRSAASPLAPDRPAASFAEDFFDLLNEGRYDKAYYLLGDNLRQTADQVGFVNGMKHARDWRGKLVDRVLQTTHDMQDPPGNPPGFYVQLIYGSKFENSPQTTEKVTLLLTKSGQWKVDSYYIWPPPSQ